MDGSLPASSVHGILQARILEWVAVSLSRGTSRPRDQTQASCIGRWVLYHWATREALLLSQIDLNTQKERRANGQYVLNYSWDTNRICARPHLPTHMPPPPPLLVKRRTDRKQLAGGSGELGARQEVGMPVLPDASSVRVLPSYWHLSSATCSLKEC